MSMPTPPESRLDAGGWKLYDRETGTVVSLPTARIREHTLVYEDAALRAAIGAATGDSLDRPWRFFFATRLSISPPPFPGVGTASWYPTVATAARDGFADDLEARGFRDVDRGRSQRLHVVSGARARLTKFTATYPVDRDGARDLPVEGWLAVWAVDGEFRLAGGAYPTTFDGLLSATEDAAVDVDPHGFRDELLGLIRGVE